MNTTSLIGSLTRDPELRTLPGSEKSVLDLRLAVRRPRSSKSGIDVDYFSVTLFGRPAEIVAQYSAKGRRIGVTGRLQHDEWGEGENRRSRVIVIADDVTVIDWPARSEAESLAQYLAADADPDPIAA